MNFRSDEVSYAVVNKILLEIGMYQGPYYIKCAFKYFGRFNGYAHPILHPKLVKYSPWFQSWVAWQAENLYDYAVWSASLAYKHLRRHVAKKKRKNKK